METTLTYLLIKPDTHTVSVSSAACRTSTPDEKENCTVGIYGNLDPQEEIDYIHVESKGTSSTYHLDSGTISQIKQGNFAEGSRTALLAALWRQGKNRLDSAMDLAHQLQHGLATAIATQTFDPETGGFIVSGILYVAECEARHGQMTQLSIFRPVSEKTNAGMAEFAVDIADPNLLEPFQNKISCR